VAAIDGEKKKIAAEGSSAQCKEVGQSMCGGSMKFLRHEYNACSRRLAPAARRGSAGSGGTAGSGATLAPAAVAPAAIPAAGDPEQVAFRGQQRRPMPWIPRLIRNACRRAGRVNSDTEIEDDADFGEDGLTRRGGIEPSESEAAAGCSLSPVIMAERCGCSLAALAVVAQRRDKSRETARRFE
jgi:hypothetical protein